ncbi:MAG: hypothetical protein H6591_14055 [Flavobacteriales bacterium]|nr:hypothetical protein [Flavobacteriales bacterium]
MSTILCSAADATIWHDTVANWLQGIGAAVAIPGAIAAFIVLFRRDKQKDEMIKHMAAQVGQLSGQVFHLKNIHEAIAEGIRIMSQSEELNQKVRKIKIRPQFEFGSSLIKPGHTEAEIELLNRGGDARNFAVRIIKGDDVQIRLPELVRSGEELMVRLFASRKMTDLYPHLEIHFDDEEGTRYQQRILLESGSVKVTQPQLLERR